MSSTKSILITGCSTNGIGAALAHVLARRGHHIFATARDPAKIPEALRSLTNATILLLDVENTASVVAAAQAVAHSGRGLDVPVNNAGAGYARPVLDMDNAAVQRVHDIDFWGPTRTAQVFADLLIASRGRVVNVSSSASVTYSPWVSAYATSKAALNTLSETIRLELVPFCVSVVTILPGYIDSNLHVNNAARFNLPPTSRYASISKIIKRWANGKVLPNDGLSAEKFAELIVHDIVGSRKGGLASKGPYAVPIHYLTPYQLLQILQYNY